MNSKILKKLGILIIPVIVLLFLTTNFSKAQTGDQSVYADSLQNGWENWSWAETNFNNPNPVRGGAASIGVNAGAWQALYFHHAAFSTQNYTHLNFWIHGGASGGQLLQVNATVGNEPQAAFNLPALTNGWQEISIPLASLGVGAATMDGFWIQERTGAAQPVFYVDDVKLISGTAPPPPPGNAVTIQIDANLNRHPINPLIYGVAHASTAQLLELNAPLNRSGGNNTSRYNWQQNADNRANDWYFQSIPFANQPGEVGDTFIQTSKNANALPMLTVPMTDWIAKVGPNREKLASFSIAKYGAQTDRDWEWFPDAGNGVRTNGQFVTGNDPNDANVPNSVAFQRNWVNHLVNRWGTAAGGGLRYYILDNEHSIWHSTHRDVHPTGLRMQDAFAKMRDYSLMVKSIDPQALTVGPEEWGWSGFLYSGYDQQYAPAHNWTYPDRAANGNMDYMPWLLQQFRQYEQANGRRLLDVFTLHYYPQGGEYSENVSTEMQLRRNRSTRSLWDPNYTDETWINDRVRLVPRMKQWVAQYYPNTKTGLTEYSWGAENHINGATAQADILGILGRENIDMATRWTTPAASTPTFKAMKMYRNYDGQNSGFGETSVAAAAPNPDNVSAFAAVRTADGALTVMVVNKIAASTPVTINLSNFSAGAAAEVWQMTAANQIDRRPDASVAGGAVSVTVPAQSITLFVIPGGASTAPNAPANLIGSVSLRRVSLAWQDMSSDETGFVIERAFATQAGEPKSEYVEVGRVSANQTGWLSSGKVGTFLFRVRAARGDQFSAPSNAVVLKVK